MFGTILCPSSGTRYYNIHYQIGLSFCKVGRGSVNVKLWFLMVYVMFYINATPSIFTERNDQCGNQHYSLERLMMGIVVPETC